MSALRDQSAAAIVAVATVLPLLLITMVVGLVAVISACSRSREGRAHSLLLLRRLTDFAGVLRGKR